MTISTKFAQKGCFQSKRKKVNSITEFSIFELVSVTNFSFNWQFWLFGPNLPKKGISTQKQKKWTASLNSACSNYCRHQISASTDNFDFSDQIYPKTIFPLKNKKREQYHWILHIRISPGTKISASTDNFEFFDQIFPKRVFSVKNKIIEHHHWILHVWISVGIKFQLKVTILILWTKFAQKGYFQSKTERTDITIELCMLELE